MAAVRSNNLGRPRPRLKDFVSIDSDLETSIKCLSVLPKNINASRSSVHYSSSGALVRRIKSSSCFRLRLSPVVERASLARPTLSGVHDRALATADKLCSSSCSNPWSGVEWLRFCGQVFKSNFVPKARPATLRVAMRAGTTGLSPGF
jgi:hypothetical protein